MNEDRDVPTRRELEALRLAAKGYGNKQIAQTLEISPHTVKNYLGNVFLRLKVSNRTEAVVVALRLNLITLENTGESPAKN